MAEQVPDLQTLSQTPITEQPVDLTAKDALDRFLQTKPFSTEESSERVRIQQELPLRVLPYFRETIKNLKQSSFFKMSGLLLGLNAPDRTLYEIFTEMALENKVCQNPDGSTLSNVVEGMLATAPDKDRFTRDVKAVLTKIDQGSTYNRYERSVVDKLQNITDEQFKEKKDESKNILAKERRDSRNKYAELFPNKPLFPERNFERIVTTEAKEQRRKARILKRSSAFQALFHVIRHSETFKHIQAILERGPELRLKGAPSGSRYRDYTALFTALATDPQGSILLDAAIDLHIEHNSQEYRAKFDAGENYIPTIIIGSGPHSGAFAAEYQRLNPGNPPLILEKDWRIGGNFSIAEVGVANVNSRNRPESVDKSQNIPGKRGNLNSLGNTVIQLSDISTVQYPPLADLGRANRINHIFNYVYSGINVQAVMKGATVNQEGSYRIETIDQRDQKEVLIFADRVIDTSGLGKEITGLDESDIETSQILAEELLREEGAQVLTFQQFQKEMGSGKKAFPLQGYKDVAVVGPEDSGRVATELLLGYGPARGLSSPNFDFTENVYWFGQSAEDKNKYISKTRVRYANLALDFPRDPEGTYYHRINPIPEKAQRLRRTQDGKIQILYTDSTGLEQSRIVDHVIIAAGFKNETNKVLEDVSTLKDPTQIASYISEIENNSRVILPGTEYGYKTISIREKLKINRIGNRLANFTITYRSGSTIELDLTPTLLLSFLKDTPLEYIKEPIEDEIVQDGNGNPVARKYSGEEIYRLGPSANLPPGSDELRNSPALSNIPPNTASLFRLIPKDLELASRLSKADEEKGIKTDFFETQPILKTIDSLGPTEKINLEVNQIKTDLHRNAPYELMLKMAIVNILHTRRLPKSLKRISFQIKAGQANGTPQLQLITDGSLSSPEYNEMLAEFAGDPIIIEALFAKTSIYASKSAILTIPLSKGMVDTDEIEFSGIKQSK